jgi:hypothetical protein
MQPVDQIAMYRTVFTVMRDIGGSLQPSVQFNHKAYQERQALRL